IQPNECGDAAERHVSLPGCERALPEGGDGPIIGVARRLLDRDGRCKPQVKLVELGGGLTSQLPGVRTRAGWEVLERSPQYHSAGCTSWHSPSSSTQTVVSILVRVPIVPFTQRWSGSLRRNTPRAPTLSSTFSSAGYPRPPNSPLISARAVSTRPGSLANSLA